MRREAIVINSIHGISSSRRGYINALTNASVFSTHGGTGSTSQYTSYPTVVAEFDRLFDESYSNTVSVWSGQLNATTSLNFTNYTTLTNAGVTVPNSGSYFSIEVSFLIRPKETGVYTFQIDSDDGSDLYIDGVFVVSYYGGHGTGSTQTGTYTLTQGRYYSVVARAQEYAGGEGLLLKWKRPSQGTYSLQSDEIYIPRV
jgi:hypothetical protein